MSNEIINQRQRLSCTVVRDLLPNYIENLTSNETNVLIEEHLSTCGECTALKDAMVSDIASDKVPVDPDIKKIMVRTKSLLLLKGILLSLGAIAVLVCFIVDMAINHKLTWSLIVDGGIAYAYLTMAVFRGSSTHRIKKTIASVSILLLPYLYLIQTVINKNFVSEPVYWFASYAVPISLLWIGVIWLILILQAVLKLNFWHSMMCFMACVLIASPLTSMFATKLPFWKAYMQNFEWIDAAAYVVCIIVCYIIGKKRKGKGMF